MHELGIAQEIVAIVCEHAPGQGHPGGPRDRQARGDPARRDPVLLRPCSEGTVVEGAPSTSSRSPASLGAATAAAT